MANDLSKKAREAIKDAVAVYQWYTCISLRPVVFGDKTFLYFIDGDICGSYIGRQSDYGSQYVGHINNNK